MPPNIQENDRFRLRAHIESLLQEEFFNRKVYSLVDARVAEKVQDITERYIDRNLPSQVAKQLIEQVPKFLDQNSAMRDILEKQQASMTGELISAARSVLDRISKESQYHDVREAYIRSIDEKFCLQLRNQNNLFEENMKCRMHLIDNADQRIKSLEMWNKVTSTAVIGLALGFLWTSWKH